MELLLGVGVSFCAVALVLAGASYRLARASAPTELLARVAALSESLKTYEIRCETSESRVQGYAAANSAMLEDIDGMLISVEKKRRQAAASDSRARLKAEQEEPEAPPDIQTMSRADLRSVARQRGLLS